MDVTVRRLQKGEELAFVRSVRIPFLEPATDEDDERERDERWAAKIEPERAWVAEDERGRFVANSCVYTMNLTLPASRGEVPSPVSDMAGVSAVGVHPTHRRRGLLSQMMAGMLDDARSRGDAIAGLIASESIIYDRFGFGHATDLVELTIDARHAAFTHPAPDLAIRLIERAEAADVLPALFERQRRSRPGDPNRTDQVWADILADRKENRQGGAAAFTAVCDDGYVRYRAHDDQRLDELAKVVVEDLRGTTAEVEAALWRFIFDLDLVGPVVAKRRPVDEPVRWRLADPRQLHVDNVTDFLHVRLLDVPAALTARGYRRSGRLTVDVLPPRHVLDGADPAVGRWVLDAGPDGASCRPATERDQTDLRLRVTDLGSLYLGGFTASNLAAGGRIDEVTAGSLDVADALFATQPAPLTGTGF